MNYRLTIFLLCVLTDTSTVFSQPIIWREIGSADQADVEVFGTMVAFVDGEMSALVRYDQQDRSVDLIRYGWGKRWGNFTVAPGATVSVAPHPAIPTAIDNSSVRLPGIPLGKNRFGTAFLTVWRPVEISVGAQPSHRSGSSITTRCVMISVLNYAEPKGLGLEYQLLSPMDIALPRQRTIPDLPFGTAIRLRPNCISPNEAKILSGVSDDQDPVQTETARVRIRLWSYAPDEPGLLWHQVDNLHTGWKEVFPLKRTRLWNMFFAGADPSKLKLVTHVLIVLLPQNYAVNRIPARGRNEPLPGKPWLLPNIDDKFPSLRRSGELPLRPAAEASSNALPEFDLPRPIPPTELNESTGIPAEQSFESFEEGFPHLTISEGEPLDGMIGAPPASEESADAQVSPQLVDEGEHGADPPLPEVVSAESGDRPPQETTESPVVQQTEENLYQESDLVLSPEGIPYE